MRCSKCGFENPAAMKFCGHCTEPLPLICPKCQFQNPPGFKFCGQCTAALAVDIGATKSRPSSRPSEAIRVTAQGSEALDGERKTVTALFADIKGSMDLIEDLDPEEARALVDPAINLMIEGARRYDGYIVQSTGDGVFALFGAPVAHEDHPQKALYAALRMQQEMRRYGDRMRQHGQAPLQVRVGVNTGEVVVRSIKTGEGHTEYTPIGHSTSLASRLQSLATPGSTVISEQTRKFVEGYFLLKPLGPARVKGVSAPVNVYEVTGLGPLRTRLQRSAGRGLTKFVGRQREMDALRHAADLARDGHGQIAAAMAEAGTGKSRLFFEFKAVSQSGWMVLETFSVSHGKASAYLPVIELLWNYFKITTEDDERTRREKVTGRVLALDRTLENTLPYLFGLLGIVEGDDPLAQMDGQIKKRRTLEAIKRILSRESLNQPLMVIFEDLHWIDDETQGFLNLLADSIGTAKVLLLVNYRPEYSHHWNSKTFYTQLRLDPLGKESAEEMLTALVGDSADVRPLKRLIIERTGGNPFFMEETFQVLLDEGALVRDGAAVSLTKSLSDLEIPPTVQAILAARIDRLPTNEKDLLQALAVIGKEFKLSLVRAVTGKSEDDLNPMLGSLQLAEFIYEQPAGGDVEYSFKHALTQEVAYNSVLVERRKQLHERAGIALESMFAGQLDDHLDELAHHYSRSANPGKAVEYLTRAGQQALTRSAIAEAQAQLQQGLEWIKKLAESPERDSRELELASTLAQVLLITKGFTAPETRAAAERARDLAEKGGNLAQLVVQVFGIFRSVNSAYGDYSTAALLADRILDLAKREGSPASFGFAYAAQVMTSFFRGDLVGTEERFARLSDFLDADGFGQASGAAVAAIGHAAICALACGHANIVRERIARAIAFARNSKNPYDLASGRMFESWLSCLLREPRDAEVAATQALAIAEEHGFPFMRDFTRPLLGWARARLGRAGEGVALIRQGLTGLAEAGFRGSIPDHLTRQAEAQALDGKIDDALITIEEALQTNPEQLVYRPNALTCRGELRLKRGHTELAEADFRDAIALAQKMQAKAWELHATMSVARLLCDTNRRDEARAMLADIYNWFTEGFDTADLKDAKTLLDELNREILVH
jgi:class 3 adenylate cyclase/tetratricopeptide (TPR) repeat protein